MQLLYPFLCSPASTRGQEQMVLLLRRLIVTMVHVFFLSMFIKKEGNIVHSSSSYSPFDSRITFIRCCSTPTWHAKWANRNRMKWREKLSFLMKSKPSTNKTNEISIRIHSFSIDFPGRVKIHHWMVIIKEYWTYEEDGIMGILSESVASL